MLNITDFEMINAEEVPEQRYKAEYWDALFQSIPKGKAIIIPKEIRTAGAVRRALWLRHQQKKFTNLSMVQRGDKTYIINPST